MDIRSSLPVGPSTGSQIAEKIGSFAAPNQSAAVSAPKSADLTGAAALPEPGRIEAAQAAGEAGENRRSGSYVDVKA